MYGSAFRGITVSAVDALAGPESVRLTEGLFL